VTASGASGPRIGGAGGMALVAAGLGGASASDDGPVLQLEMIREFSGEDDLAKADMLVLRGLGLADVSVRGAHMARRRRATHYARALPVTAVRAPGAGSQGGPGPHVALAVAQRAAPDRAAPRRAAAARRAKRQQKCAVLAQLP